MAQRKGKRSEEGQYVNLSYAMLKSIAWRSLSGNAVRVWLELHTRYNGGNNGAVRLSMAEAAEALGIGKATAGRAFAELQEKGFIVMAKQGNWYHRQAHEWRLTTKSMQRVKGREAPTNDWRSWHPRKKTGRGSKTVPSAKSMVPQQNPKGADGTEPEPVSTFSAQRFGSGMEH